MNTLYEYFNKSVLSRQKNNCLGYFDLRNYRNLSYLKVNNLVIKLVNYFLAKGLKQGDKVIIISENRWEWPIIDLASNYLGIIVVPIHTTYGSKYFDYIISNVKPKIIFLSNQKKLDILDDSAKDVFKDYKVVALNDNVVSQNFEISYFLEILDSYDYEKKIDCVSNENLISTIIYTSGTTGMPKGVPLTNKNIISNIINVLDYIKIYPHDRFFSILPLSHVLERTAGQFLPLFVGASIYYGRSTKTIATDIKKVKPSVFISVPRIFEKIFDKVNDKIRSSNKNKQKFFYKALKIVSNIKRKEKNSQKKNFLDKLKINFFDFLILRNIRNIFGGNIRLVISGGSSLNKKIAKFFEDVGINIIEGYGLTETSPIISVNKLEKFKFGTVGFVLNNLEVKINEDKEILVKGSSVMDGYWNNNEATEKVIQDSWFKTGDLGFIDADGFLNIIGRKKEIIVLSTGKNIVPANIEHALNYDKYMNQSIVVGNNRKYLTALIVPDFEELSLYANKNNIVYDSDLRNSIDEWVYKFYENRIKFVLKSFSNFEQIGKFYLMDREFNQENDELTPTLKLKRNIIESKFNSVINKLY